LENIIVADLTRAATWRVCEPKFEPQRQHHRETIFTQGNGYLGTRGTLEERFVGDRQATLIHGFWDDVPVAFTELVNAPNWTAFELWVNGRQFRLDQGLVIDYARYLDLRTGVLHRRLCWKADKTSPLVEIRFERFPSLADPHLLLVRAQITALEAPVALKALVDIDGAVDNEGFVHLDRVSQQSSAQQVDLLVNTRKTKKLLGLSACATVAGAEAKFEGQSCRCCPGLQISLQLDVGQTVVIDKFVAIYTGRDTGDPLSAARTKAMAARQMGYETIRAANDAAWRDFWEASDVVIEGDDEAQVALRHALYQLRIAAPTNDEHVSIGAKTLSGFGYRGHVFWDTEIFVLPFFTFTQPALARNMLMYRWHTFPGARRKAAANGFSGAQYAWESAETGDDVTPVWVPHFTDPKKLARIWTGDLALHINADVVYAMYQYWQATGDDLFWRQAGIPVLLETAIYWGERAEFENGKFSFRNVIGPDEYHDHVDNNAYTNGMVRWHLQIALQSLAQLEQEDPEYANQLKEKLEITPERLSRWKEICEKLVFLQDARTGLIEQFEGFFGLKEVNWPVYEDRTKSMHEILGIEGANEYQVIKQADVVMLLCLLRDQFDRKTWKANWDYYNPRTDHAYGSSLSPAMYAWAACELGEPELAYEHFMRAARADLEDVRGNAHDGIHAASAGGLWQAVVFGFAGLKLTDEGSTVNPRLPSHWKRLAFSLQVGEKSYQFDLGKVKRESHSPLIA